MHITLVADGTDQTAALQTALDNGADVVITTGTEGR